MTITRWTPLRDIATLQDRIERMFGDPQYWGAREEGTYGGWIPPVEIFEKEDNLVLRAEIPGMTQKDIELHVENGVLTLKGEKRREQELNQDSVHRAERYYGTFVRTFSLPTTVDVDKIRASYKEGVLEVVLPKAETAKPKRIEIR
jgi:HSP20 family protein